MLNLLLEEIVVLPEVFEWLALVPQLHSVDRVRLSVRAAQISLENLELLHGGSHFLGPLTRKHEVSVRVEELSRVNEADRRRFLQNALRRHVELHERLLLKVADAALDAFFLHERAGHRPSGSLVGVVVRSTHVCAGLVVVDEVLARKPLPEGSGSDLRGHCSSF